MRDNTRGVALDRREISVVRCPRPAANVGAVTLMEVWPVDRMRGAWVNGGKSLGRSRWLGVGVDEWLVEAPAEGEAYAAFFSFSYHFMYGFNDSIVPFTCVDRPGATGVFHGAAARRFAVRAEYHAPGFWVALRSKSRRRWIAGRDRAATQVASRRPVPGFSCRNCETG